MDAKIILIVALVAITLGYIGAWWAMARRTLAARQATAEPVRPTPRLVGIGFITNFFDTLGIGSFATTTAIFRFWGLVEDERIPGTLNVGHTLPTVIQAVIYTQLVEVEFRTLALMIAGACAGAWLGAGLVAGLPRRGVQLGMGAALMGAAVILVLQLVGAVPSGGAALALHGRGLALGLAGNFVLGALMTIGIGLYAPCMILISMLGMNPTAAFPIMMGSCAFLMPVGSLQFVRKDAYDLRASLGLAAGGPLAVLIAAFIVKSLPLFYLKWLVVAVVTYTGAMMVRSAQIERARATGPIAQTA